MIRRNRVLGFAAITAAVALQGAAAVAETPKGYNTPIPPSIMTPNQVETRLGTLKFFDGLPTRETVRKLYNNLDFMRGVQVFLDGIPPASLEAMRRGHVKIGATRANHLLLFDRLMDSNPLFLTGNTDTVYASAILDLKRDGPTVVEIPAGSGPGTLNDAWFRYVIDMGPTGPDRGKGGKYLILPPGYKGPEPKGYHVARSPSYVNWLILRGFLVDGKPDAAAKMFATGLRIYPLKAAKNPPKMKMFRMSGKSFNTIHANDFVFYEELNQVIQYEPVGVIDPETRGLIASIGIVKGKPFEPDARMKKILVEAAAVGNATARAMSFRTRQKEAILYEGSQWQVGFLGGDYRWLKNKGKGGRYLDARTIFFYMATVNTPAMTMRVVGKGSQYAFAIRDAKGNYLDGGMTYRLKIPANAPARDFWSIVVYDPQTRSQIQTGQPFPSKNNKRDKLITNPDGSVTLWFAPKPPAGKKPNWIQTVPGKGWFALLRLYGPEKPWFDKSWRPGEIELVKIAVRISGRGRDQISA